MTTRNVFIGVVVVFAAVAVGFLSGLVVWGRVLAGQPPLDLDNPDNWTLTRSYTGELDPSEGIARARVYFIWRPSDETTSADSVFQNKIDIETSRDVHRFMWKTSQDFGGAWCEILDLDHDGSKEFVLIQGEQLVRVVSYARGQFTFREGTLGGADEFLSTDPVDLLDLDHDGLYEFVGAGAKAPGDDKIEPLIKRWTRQSGFQDATKELLDAYYRYAGELKGTRRR